MFLGNKSRAYRTWWSSSGDLWAKESEANYYQHSLEKAKQINKEKEAA